MNFHPAAVISDVVADETDITAADRSVVLIQISNKSFQWINSFYRLLLFYEEKSKL